ncbi:MAG: class I SAM-dependent methyltransferase [Gammaproteobacteria bacterium]
MVIWKRKELPDKMGVGPMDSHGLAILEHVKTGREQWFSCYRTGSTQPHIALCSSIYVSPSKSQLEVVRQTTNLCRGKVLDVGAGGGYAALVLQEHAVDVTALDLSSYCVEAMRMLGVANCEVGDIRSYDNSEYDTVLMLDSVFGCTGSTEGMSALLSHMHSLLRAGGQILMHDGTESEGVRVHEWSGHFEYENFVGEEFQWCSVSRKRLAGLAVDSGWSIDFPSGDLGTSRYIARLTSA